MADVHAIRLGADLRKRPAGSLNSHKEMYGMLKKLLRMFRTGLRILHSFSSLARYYLLYYRKHNLTILMLAPSGIVFLEPLVEKLESKGSRFIVLMPSLDYRKLKINAPVLYVDGSLLWLVKGECLLSENSGVEMDWVRGFKNRIHSFHSPISMFRIYPEGAFDAFNIFIASGAHHVKEAKWISKVRGLPEPEIINGGYLRIESIYEHSLSYKRTNAQFTVLVAPSWGEENIVNTLGLALIEELLRKDYRVIFRPHPGNEINDKAYIDEIRRRFSGKSGFNYDSWTGMDALCEADVLIGDWSGLSFEYACALDRPVVFIDTKPKSYTNKFSDVESFEAYAREKVGVVVAPGDVEMVLNAIKEMKGNMSSYQEMIRRNKHHLFYNCPLSSDSIFEHVVRIIDRG